MTDRCAHLKENTWREVADALTWGSPQQFADVRTVEVVPSRRQRQLVQRLLRTFERLIVGVFNEYEREHTAAARLEPWGLTASRRSVRANRHKPGVKYRVLWVDQ